MRFFLVGAKGLTRMGRQHAENRARRQGAKPTAAARPTPQIPDVRGPVHPARRPTHRSPAADELFPFRTHAPHPPSRTAAGISSDAKANLARVSHRPPPLRASARKICYAPLCSLVFAEMRIATNTRLCDHQIDFHREFIFPSQSSFCLLDKYRG